MRKVWLLITLAVLVALAAFPVQAQEAQPVTQIPTRLAGNAILRSGPGLNTAWYEYLARGRSVIATGRDSDTQWIELSVGGQFFGWVPTTSLEAAGGVSFSALPVKPGLRSNGQGQYNIDHPALRAVEVDMIALQRQLQQIAARYSRLQGFLASSCENIPAVPAAPVVPAGDIAAIPELETFQREMSFAHGQITIAIDRYRQICNSGRGISDTVYREGLQANDTAIFVLKNLRLYLNSLTGLEMTNS